METLTQQLKELLLQNGADLVGVADLHGLTEPPLERGVSVIVRVQPEIVRSIEGGPNKAYHLEYHRLNDLLAKLTELGSAFLNERGYRAQVSAATFDVGMGDNTRTKLPHKTVATNAGLGWVGKHDLLVTPEYGSAVRLGAILTDAPLACNEPVTQSRCGGCKVCTNGCPAQAVRGVLWQRGMDRDELVDIDACRKVARRLAFESFGMETTICGRCFALCPYTQRYLRRELGE